MTTNGNQELFNRALHLIPGGVNSPVRAFGSVGGTPRFIKKAKGSRMLDKLGKVKINNFATYEIKPDITFLIDVSSKLASRRRKKSELDRIEKVGNKFQEQVRDQYLKLASKNENRFVTLDGKPTPENIHKIIWNKFKIAMKKRKI